MPSLTTASDFSSGRPGRLAVVGGGVLICAVAVLVYVVSTQNPTPKSSTGDQAVQAPTGKGAAAPPASSTRPPPAETTQVGDKGAADGTSSTGNAASRSNGEETPRKLAVQPPPGAGRAASPSSRGEAPSESAVPATTAAAPADSAPPQPSPVSPAANAAAPASGEIQARTPSLKEALSKMTLNILVYDDSEAARRVVINGKKYVKGDYIDGHYLIEDITIEGAVLSYEGERVVLRPR